MPNYNKNIDSNSICYLPFDSNGSIYGSKKDNITVNFKQSILSTEVPNSNFKGYSSITTKNIENNDYLDIVFNSKPINFTIEFWFKFKSFKNKDDWFIEIYMDHDELFNVARINESDGESFRLGTLNSDNQIKEIGETIMKVDQWNHFCCTYNSINKKFVTYINGKSQFQLNGNKCENIENIKFYTCWGGEFDWQSYYCNIIISDIVRYDGNFKYSEWPRPLYGFVETEDHIFRNITRNISDKEKITKDIPRNVVNTVNKEDLVIRENSIKIDSKTHIKINKATTYSKSVNTEVIKFKNVKLKTRTERVFEQFIKPFVFVINPYNVVKQQTTNNNNTSIKKFNKNLHKFLSNN